MIEKKDKEMWRRVYEILDEELQVFVEDARTEEERERRAMILDFVLGRIKLRVWKELGIWPW